MKKAILLTVVFLALLSLPFSVLATNNNQNQLPLSLPQAIEIALAKNHSLLLAKLDLDQAEAELTRAKVVNDPEMLETAQEKRDTQSQKYEEQVSKLTSDVRNKYYEMLQQKANVQNQAKALERSESQLLIDKAKYDAGIIAALDIMRSENSNLTANNNYENAKISLATKHLEFNKLLGLDLDIEVVLVDQITVDFVPFDLELDFAYEMALDHDPSIIQAQENLTKAIDKINAVNNPFTPRAEYEDALINRDKMEIQLLQALQNLFLKIRSDFYSIQTSEKNVYAKERDLQLEQQLLEAEQVKYNAGIISNAAIVSQQEKLAQAENAYTEAIWNYTQAKNNFLVQIGLPEANWGADL